MQHVARTTLQRLAGGQYRAYEQVRNAMRRPPVAESPRMVEVAPRPLPPNWNVRPGDGAYGEGWSDANDGMG